MEDDEIEVPSKSPGDVAHSIAKAGLSAVPVIGGPAAELFQNVVQPPLEKRRGEWMAKVGEKLQELEKNGLNLEDLKENEQFISAAMYASHLALRTHQEEKIAALRNAVVNIATDQAPEEALQHIFLDFIDSLTEVHLRILKLFQEPTPPPNISMGGLSSVLEHNIPEMRNRRDLYDQFWRDLYSRGLVNTDGLHLTMTGNGLGQKRTTAMGDSFLRFISESE
ncbi:hypothetical protein [Thiohalophilus sp.]|uniref:hypothetical protein n=1 Tax=Thiohalophilus sp. TaxID=3028392 RepID=UPI002ACEE9B8|nr:hypothetical protein [Thiohalophilus sp.]MDZ7660937.1 hypothetical protein [Thiohalophilus sp.]